MNNPFVKSSYLPVTLEEMNRLGWEQADIILISGDAYIDHPAFGAAIMGRLAESLGFKVAILPQPNWRDDLRDFKKLGVPKYFFGITAGSMDSMINHYTALKRKRSNDAYTPGGRPGQRPDYASVVYTQIVKKLYPEIPVILGGVEASMRRLTHYDYWSDTVKPSVLTESGADLLLYGMAEQAFSEILNLLKKGVPFHSLKNIPQTAFTLKNQEKTPDLKNTKNTVLPSHEKCTSDKIAFAEAFRMAEESAHSGESQRLIQKTGLHNIIINPQIPFDKDDNTDYIYELPFTRMPHPKYHKKESIPAYEMIKFSVNIHRGCFGGCSFCAIAAHQGKFIRSRSESSVLQEVQQISKMPDFKGHISDLGGPSANMYKMGGKSLEQCKKCKRPSCISPALCPNLNFDHKPLIHLYEKASQLPGIKKITIGSGIRYDMLIGRSAQQNKEYALDEYTRRLLKNHVSGRLKVAPEHTSARVLKLMRKPSFQYFEDFHQVFQKICKEEGLPWQLIPYFISGHPGCSHKDMEDLASITRKGRYFTEKAQEFTPTPMTMATTMYYTGIHPYTGEQIFATKNKNQKRRQKTFFIRK